MKNTNKIIIATCAIVATAAAVFFFATGKGNGIGRKFTDKLISAKRHCNKADYPVQS